MHNSTYIPIYFCINVYKRVKCTMIRLKYSEQGFFPMLHLCLDIMLLVYVRGLVYLAPGRHQHQTNIGTDECTESVCVVFEPVHDPPCSALNPCKGTLVEPVTNCRRRPLLSSVKASTACVHRACARCTLCGLWRRDDKQKQVGVKIFSAWKAI